MKVLFASPYCLLDTTSGAALATRDLLEALAQRNFVCEVVTASIFDPPRDVSLAEMLLSCGVEKSADGEIGKPPVVQVDIRAVRHTILRTTRSGRKFLTPGEGEALLSLVEEKISALNPDLLLTYGGLKEERRIHGIARQRGIPVVFYLHNSLYSHRETFSSVDVTLVPSRFLQGYYAGRLGIATRVLYPIFAAESYRITRSSPRYITFINPVPAKGLTLFLAVAREARLRIPLAEFLVVEGRWGRADVEQAGGAITGVLPNVKIVPNQKDMRPIYAATRMLLYPSFSVEAFGKTVVEAQANGIAVLAARNGGIPEALNGGGFLFDVPERCLRNHGIFPTAAEIEPWLVQIRKLLEDTDARDQAEMRAREASRRYQPEMIVDEAVEIMQEAIRTGPRAPTAEGHP